MTISFSGPNVPIVLSFVTLVVSFFLTTPTIYAYAIRLTSKQRYGESQLASKFYEDEDGVATEEACKEFSARFPKYLALTSAMVGFAISVASSVLYETRISSPAHLAYWFTFGCSTLLLVQVWHVTSIQDPVRRFKHAILGSATSAAIALSLLVREAIRLEEVNDLQQVQAFVVLDTIQLCAAIVSCIACFSLPRRPSLMHDDLLVDGQYTVSALARYTFAWAGPTLNLAKSIPKLELTDIPLLHLHSRSFYLEQFFDRQIIGDHLLKRLLLTHWLEISFQTLFAIGMATAGFLPQLAMLGLLRLLEQKSEDPAFYRSAWALVIGLGLAVLIQSWSEAWLHWIVYSRLALTLRTELSAMIFTKAMRRKDVKGVAEEVDIAKTDVTQAKSAETPAKPDDSDATGDLEEGLQKTRQATINLVGVDSKRISDFATYYFIFATSITEMVVGIIFLLKLLGWRSLLSGFAIFIIVIPLNVVISKKFSDAQGDLMSIRDKKLVLVTEALQGIRQIKFSAQERQWQTRIGNMRTHELAAQWRVFYLDVSLIGFWILGPVMLSAISLAVYAYLQGNLSASTAFTSISVFSSLEMTFAVLPELISDGIEAYVSVKRIDEYLKAPEKEESKTPENFISFQNASVAWPADSTGESEDRFVLRDLNIRFPNKQLSVVSGSTGSGKSLLLAALIGEADSISGRITCPQAPPFEELYDHRANRTDWILDSALAFVAQIPWIENATIKENILFGLPFDSSRYKKVLKCCALKKDLEILPDGDQTDIGANGINLSGGQRWRVSFARALYSRAGILILDDIFSAVDAHVGRQLFEEALTGELGRGRTRILVTHHVGLTLPKAEYAVILATGRIKHAGLVKELSQAGVIDEFLKTEESVPSAVDEQDRVLRRRTESFAADADDMDLQMLRKIVSNTSQRIRRVDTSEIDAQGKSQPRKFTEEEKRESGSIKWTIYAEYLRSSGAYWFWVPIMTLYCVHQGIVLLKSWLISLWTKSYKAENASMNFYELSRLGSATFPAAKSTATANDDLAFYIGMYLGLSIIVCLTGTSRYLFVYIASLKASKKLFDNITHAILRAPLRWLDTVPVGRILNRLTADFDMIDSKIGNDMAFLLYQIIQMMGIIIAGFIVSPWMMLSALVLLAACWRITRLFLAGAREVKRLESNAKSPIFEQFGSVLNGIGTIRAFGKTEEYINRMFSKIDAHARASWHLWLFNRWLIWRLNIVGATFATLVTIVIVQSRIDSSLAGFALSFALQYSSALIWSAREYANVELSMNAIERVVEYSNITIEDHGEKSPVPAAWPTEGRIEVSELVAGYAPDLPPVLKGLSFSIEKNQRVGVVGRTGAGKSSLTLALFRFLEARSGSIYIDGLDISTISLPTLRSRLAIIPQDPVLFSGTVRSNLDPFDNHSDAELYDALERVHLIPSRPGTGTTSRDEQQQPEQQGTLPSLSQAQGENESTHPGSSTLAPPGPLASNGGSGRVNKNLFKSLSSPISESGLNLSQGQRQLLTLARAIAARPKLLVMDEATSAVDMPTDALIQRSIREEFQDATLIVIAHRLSTIADFDRVLVMDDGVAVEYGPPSELWKNKDGIFRSMVDGSGEGSKLRGMLGVDMP